MRIVCGEGKGRRGKPNKDSKGRAKGRGKPVGKFSSPYKVNLSGRNKGQKAGRTK